MGEIKEIERLIFYFPLNELYFDRKEMNKLIKICTIWQRQK